MSCVKNIIILSWILTVNTSLILGHQCVDSISGVKGKIQKFSECNNYALKQKIIEFYSAFYEVKDDSIVCCPPVQLRRSEKMCQHFFSSMGKKFASKGVPARLREFRHMAAIGFSQTYRITWGCGGSIISTFFILSAAHCVKHKEFGPAKWVRVGDLDLVDTKEGANPQDFPIAQYFKHPDYISTTYYNDIALFKLGKRIIFGADYQPACLHVSRNIPQQLEAIGWGQTANFEALSTHLMKVHLNVTGYTQCQRKYRNDRKLPKGIKDELQICAGGNSGQDTCLGDSGGPLQFKNDQFSYMKPHYVVVGITSFGKGCGSHNSVSVYTRVSAHVNWIEDIVWPVKKSRRANSST